MRISTISFVMILAFLTCSFLATSLPVKANEDEKLNVVTTTSITGSIVKDLAGDKAKMDIIASASICPAHYDLKPSDVSAATDADVLIYQGIEPWVSQLQDALKPGAISVQVSGPWNIPEKLKVYYEQIASALENKIDLDNRLQECLEAIDETADELRRISEAHGLENIKVCCMQWQKSFVEELGFNVVITYPSPETLSTQDIVQIEENVKAEGVKLVVSNIQSGSSLGEALAEMGLVHVSLTNFPGTAPGLDDMISVMRYNAQKLATAVDTLEVQSKLTSTQSELQLYQYITAGLIAIVALEAILLYLMRRR